jgi:ABC-type amino acid transport substrate-binding protein
MNRFLRRAPPLYPRLLAAFLLILLILRIALGGKEDGSLTRVQQAGVLVVAFDASYPPFEMTDGQGNYSGFDTELARAIAARLGVQAQFANISFDSLYDALTGRRADVVISGLRYEAERTRDVIYTISYFDAGQTLVVRAVSPISKTADVAGRRVAVELASEGEVEAQKLAAKTSGMQLQQCTTVEDELVALRSGAVDALVADHVTALEMSKDQPDLRLLAPPFAPDPLVVAGHSDDRVLMTEISRIIKALRDDGTLSRLAQQWF